MPTIVGTAQVQELLGRGAQLVDVLPGETYLQEHIAGAISVPLQEVTAARDRLDSTRPVIVYCHDHECDLSGRAAARLELLGFTDVYDYATSKTAWLGEGLPSEGLLDDSQRATARLHRDVPRVGVDATMGEAAKAVGDWEVVVVVNEEATVVGVVRREAVDFTSDLLLAEVMQPAPPTVRPSIPLRELASTMDQDGQRHLLVTTSGGRLLGLVRRDELEDG
jgi:rhodanese-related sulfurtransferase